jgi:hypothetical protein
MLDVPPVTDLDHGYRLGGVIDGVEDAIGPLPDPILLLAGELLDALWSRCRAERCDPVGDLTANCGRQPLELLGGGALGGGC